MDKTKQSVFIATSLDGFIARPDGDIDWLMENNESGGDDYGYGKFMKSVNAIVMGRNTFEKVLSFGEWPYDKRVIVLTHRPIKIADKLLDKVDVMAGPPRDIIQQLAEKGLYHLYIDGGKTIQNFLNAGFIQQMTITNIPVLIGDGISLFGSVNKDIKLEHLATKSFENGLVQSRYHINHQS